jgi:hypothetical protein
MVDHDDVEAELARLRQRLVAGGAAIDGDEEACPSRGERANRLGIGAVAFEQAIGDVDDGTEAAMVQIPPEQRRRCRSIDVIVAQDGDRFAATRLADAVARGAHAGERVRIRHQRAHRRIEEACDLVHLDPATGENARQQLGYIVVALCDRERARRVSLVEPVAPSAPASRALDREKEAPRRNDRCRQGDSHAQARESRQKSLRYWMKPERSASLS